MKILIAGIGGVGGFLGARLSAQTENDSENSIYFLCRGNNLDAINNQGLRLEETGMAMTGRPYLAADSCSSFPIMDVILICCKSYDLDKICKEILPCVGPSSLIIPVLNGIDHHLNMKQRFPESMVANSCIYIVSKLEAPGLIVMSGASHSMFIGASNIPEQPIKAFEELSRHAGINMEIVKDIDVRVWKKFSFISPLASYTSAYRLTKGEIVAKPEHLFALRQLMEEILQLAEASGVHLPEDTIDQHFMQLSKLPDNSSSSMERDYSAGRKTELETLTNYVLLKARELGLFLSNYESLYLSLKSH